MEREQQETSYSVYPSKVLVKYAEHYGAVPRKKTCLLRHVKYVSVNYGAKYPQCDEQQGKIRNFPYPFVTFLFFFLFCVGNFRAFIVLASSWFRHKGLVSRKVTNSFTELNKFIPLQT